MEFLKFFINKCVLLFTFNHPQRCETKYINYNGKKNSNPNLMSSKKTNKSALFMNWFSLVLFTFAASLPCL